MNKYTYLIERLRLRHSNASDGHDLGQSRSGEIRQRICVRENHSGV